MDGQLEEAQFLMVTPGKFMLAILAFIAMLAILAMFVILPDTGHYAHIAN